MDKDKFMEYAAERERQKREKKDKLELQHKDDLRAISKNRLARIRRRTGKVV